MVLLFMLPISLSSLPVHQIHARVGLLPIIIFVLGHKTWGFGHLLFVFFAGGLLTFTYALKRNLALVIIAHFKVDVIALVVLPVLLEG